MVGPRVGAALLGASLLGCAPPGAFECQTDAQCGTGRCEGNGWCSFPDDACPSGSRYGGLAGDGLANECVPVGETEAGTSDPSMTGASETSGPSTTPSSSDPTAPMTATSVGPDTSDSSDDVTDTCGNGVQDADEACDDGDENDGDGCDNDCTPSGETQWEIVSMLPGADAYRDVVILDDGSAAVCGDRSAEMAPAPTFSVFSEDGTLTGSSDISFSGEAWGIASLAMLANLVVVGGTQSALVLPSGWLVAVDVTGGEFDAVEIDHAVYDIDVDGQTIWAAGSQSGTPILTSYGFGGMPMTTISAEPLPLNGTVWDVASNMGELYVAVAADSTWIGSVSGSGDERWSTGWSVPGGGSPFGISRAPNGEIIASGSVGTQGIVAVFDAEDGSERWSQLLASERGSFANIHKAVGGPAGEVVCVGWVSTSNVGADIWVGKYDSEGALVWERTFAGDGEGVDSNGWGVAVDSLGYITAVGQVANAATGYDAWIVRLEP